MLPTRRYGQAGRQFEKLEVRHMLSATAFVVNSHFGSSTSYIASADLDGDSDIDLIAVPRGESGVAWYENEDGKGNFGKPNLITTLRSSYQSLVTDDVDGDGDTDIITVSNDLIVWLQNVAGNGTFGAEIVIGEHVGNSNLVVVDIDGDGDKDVASGASWYEFDAATGSFGVSHQVESDGMRIDFLGMGDFDKDGDLDLISKAGSDFAWLENLDGEGSFGQPNLIGVGDSLPYRAGSGDFDGDGDADIWIMRRGFVDVRPTLRLYENANSRGAFVERTPSKRLTHTDGGPPCLSDFDSDGDLDILLPWGASSEDRTLGAGFIYENNNEWGFELASRPISNAPDAFSIVSSGSCAIDDFDGDGDEDIAFSFQDVEEGFLEWHENRLTGDANDDGVVNFADFLVLASNSGKAEDAVWEEGDFDGNGTVNFADFLALSSNFGNERRPSHV